MSTASSPSTEFRIATLAGIMTGISIVSIGSGLINNFIALRLTLANVPAPQIGLVATGYPVGFLIGCLATPWMVRRVGQVRAFAIYSGLTASACLLFAVKIDPLLWTVLRTISGLTVAGLFVIAESWMNDVASNELRGRVFGLYMISNKLCYGGGQLLLMVADPLGLVPYMILAACYSLCLVPVALSTASSPTMPDRVTISLSALWRISPVSVAGALTAGICNTTVVSIGPVYASQLGYDTDAVAVFTATIQFGIMLLQYPIGRLSDRGDRRKVMIGVSLATILLGIGLALFGHRDQTILYSLAFIYGGFSGTVYTLAVAHAADRCERRHLVAVSGGLLMVWAVGAMMGPLAATFVMNWLGPSGLFTFTVAVTSVLTMFVLARVFLRDGAVTRAPAPLITTPLPHTRTVAGTDEDRP